MNKNMENGPEIMSLRGELEKFFLDIGEDGEKAKAQVILSKIEKRIGSLKGQLDFKDDVMMISTLNWVKKELLK